MGSTQDSWLHNDAELCNLCPKPQYAKFCKILQNYVFAQLHTPLPHTPTTSQNWQYPGLQGYFFKRHTPLRGVWRVPNRPLLCRTDYYLPQMCVTNPNPNPNPDANPGAQRVER